MIRASAGLAEVSVARATTGPRLRMPSPFSLAASEALAPEVANRELALVALLAVAAAGSGHTDAARAS